MSVLPTVLTADNSSAVLEATAEHLNARGVTVISFRTGRELYEEGMNRPPLAAIVDLNLSDMSGLAVLRGWRHHGRNFPVVLTGTGILADHVLEARSLGEVTVLAKPFDFRRLSEAVEDALSGIGEYQERAQQRARLRAKLRSLSPLDRIAALHGLAEDGDPSVVPDIVSSLLDASARVRLQAAASMARIAHGDSMLRELLHLVRDVPEDIEFSVFETVITLCEASFISALESAMNSSDQLTKTSGRAILDRIAKIGLGELLQKVWMDSVWRRQAS